MRASCKANQLKTVHANELTLIKLKSLHLRLIKRYSSIYSATSTLEIR